MDTLSDYANALSVEAKGRYIDKISLINNVDPYTLKHKDFDEDFKHIPQITRSVITEYLLLSASWETQKEMKAYKSLDAYIQVICKWVQKVYFKMFEDVVLVFGMVLHSQKLNEPALKPWLVLSLSNAQVLCAHCNCVAGLGEVCSHVAAVLFALQKLYDDSASVTDIFAYWKKPSGKPDINLSIKDINWGVKTSDKAQAACSSTVSSDIPEMTREDMIKFLKDFKDAGQSSVLHNVLKEFEPTENKIINLYSASYEDLSLDELRKISEELTIDISLSDCLRIEENTREQHKSLEWFSFRAGRVTASKFKAVCRTSVETPAISVLKAVCYPHSSNRVFRATQYGCQHEKDALEAYLKYHAEQHKGVKLQKVGFVINPEYPEFGASPDSYVFCPECGEGCVEVKCPICVKDSPLEALLNKKQSCLEQTSEGVCLKKDHAYFYQVQLQMVVTQRKFCDFVLWNETQLYVQKILPDNQFWVREKEKAIMFFRKCILPEILGKYYTNKKMAGDTA